MKVILDEHTSLYIAAKAIRRCWDSGDKSDTYILKNLTAIDKRMENEEIGPVSIGFCGPNDKALIERVGNKFKHSSTLEHLTYHFTILGVSRALLQELARHRMASPSVKSTRYTLKELKEEQPFNACISGDKSVFDINTRARAAKYLVWTDISFVDDKSIHALEGLRQCISAGISNDKAKYCLPESYKTDLTWTINARSLQNFLSLRSSKAALWEIRDLANALYQILPKDHQYLFEDSLYKEN